MFEEHSKIHYCIPADLKNDFGKITQALQHFFTPLRFEKMQQAAFKRSRNVLVVFENTHHAHNISAILRTIDSFGFLDLFFLYTNTEIRFRIADAIDRGASQWLLPKRFTSFVECARLLKNNGYKIALVSLPDFSRTAENYCNELPAFSTQQLNTPEFQNFMGQEKIALIFGSELIGVSKEWNEYADFYLYVEMFGFTESLNVSVCAGILLHSLRERLEKQKEFLFPSQNEASLILEYWVTKNYPHAYEYISTRQPELLNWFEYVRSGQCFNLASCENEKQV